MGEVQQHAFQPIALIMKQHYELFGILLGQRDGFGIIGIQQLT